MICDVPCKECDADGKERDNSAKERDADGKRRCGFGKERRVSCEERDGDGKGRHSYDRKWHGDGKECRVSGRFGNGDGEAPVASKSLPRSVRDGRDVYPKFWKGHAHRREWKPNERFVVKKKHQRDLTRPKAGPLPQVAAEGTRRALL